MYAVIETGGKQYRVELGSEIEVDRMDVEPGQTIDLDRVLLVADGDEASIGAPLVDGATVSANVVRQTRGEKLVVFKYKPKARTRVKNGARADLTLLRIADIAWGDRSAAREGAAADAERKAAAERAARAAAEKAAADEALAARLAAAAEAAAAATATAATPEVSEDAEVGAAEAEAVAGSAVTPADATPVGETPAVGDALPVADADGTPETSDTPETDPDEAGKEA